ncbi:MAG: endonuclease [Chromatiaceae bacterium]|nr:endonuclease [Chromatiaceae bacterium]
MPTKPLDRLMFAQGGLCFFCKKPLSKSEASVEHLLASANGGSNSDENCVACCKAVNALLGSMSLKEKIQVVLNQNGNFKCPNGGVVKKSTTKAKVKSALPATANPIDGRVSLVVGNLKPRGNSRPRKLKTLRSTIASLFPEKLSESELDALIKKLKAIGKVKIEGTNVTYTL